MKHIVANLNLGWNYILCHPIAKMPMEQRRYCIKSIQDMLATKKFVYDITILTNRLKNLEEWEEFETQ